VLRIAVFNAKRQGSASDAHTSPAKNTSRNESAIDAWLHSTSSAGAFTSGWWLEGMRSASYVDGNKNIVWTVDPANTLKPWAYKHLFTITKSIDPIGSTSAIGKQGDCDTIPGRNPPNSTTRSVRRRTPSSPLESGSQCPTFTEIGVGRARRLRPPVASGAAAASQKRHGERSSDNVEATRPLRRRHLFFGEPCIATDTSSGSGAASSSTICGSSGADPGCSSGASQQ
jgi:hypothetical protein